MKNYRHYGSIGDMIKHPALSLFLAQEKPKYYCETHSAAGLYELDNGFNKKYGIFHLYANAHKYSGINNSPYIRSLRSFNPDGLKLYPGSPGIALTMLKRDCDRYIFCDINASPLKNIREFCEKRNISDNVTLYNGEGMTFVSGVVDTINDKGNIFVFIDPFDPFDYSLSSKSAFDLFVSLIRLKVKTMLWYGYGALHQRKELFSRIHTALNEDGIHSNTVYNSEIILNIIQENSMIINPGILGCGVLFAHMSDASMKQLQLFGKELELVYQNAVIGNQYDGSVKFYFGEF